MKKNSYLYFLAPLVGVAVFVFVYMEANKAYHEKEANAAKKLKDEKRAKLDTIKNRHPFQVTEAPKFEAVTSGASLHAFGEIRDEAPAATGGRRGARAARFGHRP